jgi:hypothetical protein
MIDDTALAAKTQEGLDIYEKGLQEQQAQHEAVAANAIEKARAVAIDTAKKVTAAAGRTAPEPSAASPPQLLPAPPPVSRCASSAGGAVLATVQLQHDRGRPLHELRAAGTRERASLIARRMPILAKTKSHGNST